MIISNSTMNDAFNWFRFGCQTKIEYLSRFKQALQRFIPFVITTIIVFCATTDFSKPLYSKNILHKQI